MGLVESGILRMWYFSRMVIAAFALVASLLSFFPCLSAAQEPNLARDLANPFSSVWSIANQFNFNNLKGGFFENTHTQFNWNFQPVMPVPLNDQFNVVNRMVIPYYNPFPGYKRRYSVRRGDRSNQS